MHRMMFWNNWLKFFYESYLFLGMCVALNTQYFLFNTFGNVFNSLIAVFFGIILVLLPIFVGVFYNLLKFAERIWTRDEEFFARYGSIVDSLNFIRNGQIVMLYPIASLTRKLWLVLTLVYMQG